MLVDLSKSEQEVMDSIRKMESYKSESFMRDMFDLKGKQNRLISAAKVYVLDNYQKVDDWSGLSLELYHNKSEGGGKWFGPKREKSKTRNGKRSDVIDKIFEDIDAAITQIETLNDCVYDWTDGDFSLTINGIDYLWIDGVSVISIAQYIQDFLNKRSGSSVG
jgi:hypothetical protein